MPSMKTNDRTRLNCELMAYTICRVKRAKAATDPEMSATTMISGLDGPRVAELRIGRHPSVGKGMADGAAEVQRSLAAVAPLAGQADRQLAGQGGDGLAQGGQLLPAGVHEVDVLGQRLAQRLGHRLGAPVGDQAAADLGLDLPAQGVQAGLVLLAGQPLLQVGELAVRSAARAASIIRSSTASRSSWRRVRYR